jgi:large subunit ribosomal protein L3
MSIGLVGRKCGMTRVYKDDGSAVAVTVILVEPNRVTQIKNDEVDGYSSIQVTCGNKKASRISSAEAGHFKKAAVEAGCGLWEFRSPAAGHSISVGDILTPSLFKEGDFVDVAGTSKGKGFQGTVKRWNFCMQDATHGNSLSHRAPGSIGQRQTPGRVWKGKKMSGHMGADRVTTQNLEIVRVDESTGVILVKGAVAGASGGDLILFPSIKIKARGE